MQPIGILMLVLSAALLSACEKKKVDAPVAPTSAASVATAGLPSSQPDFGGVTKVSREVEAIGSTPELALLSALQSAVAQVNGVRVASQIQSVRAKLEVSVNGQSAGSISADAFKQQVIAASQGAVAGYEVLSQEEVDKVDEETVARVRASDAGHEYAASSKRSDSGAGEGGGYDADLRHKKMRSYWKLRVRIEVAQYRAPDEQGRPKIVVALPRTLVRAFPVGDVNVAADDVARAVRGRLSDILTQTKRFIVLDREFGSEMQAEIDHINSGHTRVQDGARLGQQLATDLILIPTIERFEYPRRVQRLRMSDRELVSYSGGARVTLRLLNAATGEVVMSNSFEHKLTSADPSTLPRTVDGESMTSEMMSSLAGQIGSAIVTEIFPVSVIDLSGDQAVLSQGGEVLQAGQRWQAVWLGDEMKDPQTGRSLGRSEVPLGVVRIDRVAAKMSYASFEGGAPNLRGKPFRPGLIELRKLVAMKSEKTSAEESAAVAGIEAGRGNRKQAFVEADSPKVKAMQKNDDANW